MSECVCQFVTMVIMLSSGTCNIRVYSCTDWIDDLVPHHLVSGEHPLSIGHVLRQLHLVRYVNEVYLSLVVRPTTELQRTDLAKKTKQDVFDCWMDSQGFNMCFTSIYAMVE